VNPTILVNSANENANLATNLEVDHSLHASGRGANNLTLRHLTTHERQLTTQQPWETTTLCMFQNLMRTTTNGKFTTRCQQANHRMPQDVVAKQPQTGGATRDDRKV
jgi:hypothetical protein